MSIRKYDFTSVGVETGTAPTNTEPSASTDLATKNYVDTYAVLIAGAQSVTGAKTFTDNVSIDNQKELRFYETDANGTNYIGIKAPASVTADKTFILPNGDGSASQVLGTNGSLQLQWQTVATVESTIDAAAGTSGVTLTTADESIHVFTPSTAITVKLDNSFTAGRVIHLYNDGTNDITLTANDNSTIRTIYRKTCGIVACKSSTPTTNTSWLGLNKVVSGPIVRTSDYTVTNFGSVANTFISERRDGKILELEGRFTAGTIAASVQSIDIRSGITVETDFYTPSGTLANTSILGMFYSMRNSAGNIYSGDNGGALFFDGSDTNSIFFAISSGGSALQFTKTAGVGNFAGNNSGISFWCRFHVNEWEEFSG